MITWINGTFGSGKTTTASVMVDQTPSWRLFDPEIVGYMLSGILKSIPFEDFQDLAAWRRLVPQVAYEVASLTDSNLIAVQTVLNETYWHELAEGFSALNMAVFHVVLDCDEAVLRRRIDSDQAEPNARQWRLDHLSDYQSAKNWMIPTADLVIHTSDTSAEEVAAEILAKTPRSTSE